jgi:hypothetical protein
LRLPDYQSRLFGAGDRGRKDLGGHLFTWNRTYFQEPSRSRPMRELDLRTLLSFAKET